MYSVTIRNIAELDEIDQIFNEAMQNCKSIIGAKVSHDEILMDGSTMTYQLSYMLEIYFLNQTDAIMYELKYL
jgi:hypothetical protein